MMPPVWAGCLRVLLPPRLRFAVMRDTGTTFENLEARLGRRAALRWLRSQVRGAVGPSLRYRLESGAASMRHIGCAVTSLGADVRQAVRGAVHQPGFGVAVVLTLGLGIGGTVAIFSVVDAVLLRPLPYLDAERLVRVWESNATLGFLEDGPSPANFLDWEARNEVFDGIAAWWPETAIYKSANRAEQVEVAHVSGDFFRLLGTEPLVGRLLSPDDAVGSWYDNSGNHYGAEPVIAVSHQFWSSRLGADPQTVGRVIEVNRVLWRIIGVMPASFALPRADIDLWNSWDLGARAESTDGQPSRDSRFLGVVARLREGLDMSAAQLRLDGLAAALATEYPATNAGWGIRVTPLIGQLIDPARRPLGVLSGAVGLLLLTACANVAGLLLARSTARRGEISVRRALGATRARLVRLPVTESVSLALVGGLVGIGVAIIGVDALMALQPGNLPLAAEIGIDRRALAFGLVLSLVAGVLAGGVPAWIASSAAGVDRSTRRSSDGVRRTRLRASLVVAEIAVTLVLLVGALLLARSFARLMAVDPGFDLDNVIVIRVPLESGVASSSGNGRVAFFEQLTQRLGEMPGAEAVGATTALPMSSVGADFDRPFWRFGEPDPGAAAAEAWIRMTTPGYFRALGRPLMAGRDFAVDDRFDFSDSDWRQAERVIIVSAGLAASSWPNEDPLGKRLEMSYPGGVYAYRVVGVVGDVRHHDLRQGPQPEIFLPYAQNSYPALNVVLRTRPGEAPSVAGIEALVTEINPDQPVHSVVAMRDLVAATLARQRFAATLLIVFAGIALLLTTVGTYGLVAWSVSRRVRELGIRSALGARSSEVRAMVVREGLGLGVMGVLVGLGTSLLLIRSLDGLLYEVRSDDAAARFIVGAGLLVVTAVASYLPARRASAVEPIEALRSE